MEVFLIQSANYVISPLWTPFIKKIEEFIQKNFIKKINKFAEVKIIITHILLVLKLGELTATWAPSGDQILEIFASCDK